MGLYKLIAGFLLNSALISIAEVFNIGRSRGIEKINKGLSPSSPKYVVAYQQSAILDNKTCRICRSIDGFVFKADDPLLNKIRNPLHKSCRCIWVGITKEEWDLYPKAVTKLTPAAVAYINTNKFWV